MRKKPCIREKLEAGMRPGQWYWLNELTAMGGGKRESTICALSVLRSRGRLATMRIYDRKRKYRLLPGNPIPARRVGRQTREPYAIELLPLAQVKPHPCLVGPLDTWRGLDWRKMPGNEEMIRKLNFSLWRRGLLKYDCHNARGKVDVMPSGRMAGLRKRRLA